MELETLARPYAKAVFELAEKTGDLATWSKLLAALSATVRDARIAPLIGSPALDHDQLAELLIEVLSSAGLKDSAEWSRVKALVDLLAENRRLTVAPKIADLYEAMRAAVESRVAVEITTATPVGDAQAERLGAAIAKRLARTVEVQWKQDEALLGGAVIRADDLVIDGSLKGELERMSQALSA